MKKRFVLQEGIEVIDLMELEQLFCLSNKSEVFEVFKHEKWEVDVYCLYGYKKIELYEIEIDIFNQRKRHFIKSIDTNVKSNFQKKEILQELDDLIDKIEEREEGKFIFEEFE